jgi:hypothetical protein
MKWKGRVKCVVKIGNAYGIIIGDPQESGHAVVELVDAVCYKPEGRGFYCR